MIYQTYFYYVVEDGGGPDDAHRINSGSTAPDDVAEEAAKDYHQHHNGWEATWPLTFGLLDSDRKEIGLFSVERESVPQFIATPWTTTTPKEQQHG